MFDRKLSVGSAMLSEKARREIYLGALARGYSQTLALLHAGSTLMDLRAWNGDQEFAADAADAVNQGTDYLEDVAFARAHQSDAVLIKLLEARRPEKFTRDREVASGITIVVAPLFGGDKVVGEATSVKVIEADPVRTVPDEPDK